MTSLTVRITPIEDGVYQVSWTGHAVRGDLVLVDSRAPRVWQEIADVRVAGRVGAAIAIMSYVDGLRPLIALG